MWWASLYCVSMTVTRFAITMAADFKPTIHLFWTNEKELLIPKKWYTLKKDGNVHNMNVVHDAIRTIFVWMVKPSEASKEAFWFTKCSLDYKK